MQAAAAAFVAEHLAAISDLLDELVLTGGASIGLWLDRPTARPARPTNDVDLVALIKSRPAYYAFGERLRERGLNEDSTSRVLCRWRDRAGRTLDVMPVTESVLGFSNRWYEAAFMHAVSLELPGGLRVNCVTPPFLLATKFEAFDDPHRDRGGDYMASADMNDVIALLHGRTTIVAEVVAAHPPVLVALRERFAAFSERDLDARQRVRSRAPGSCRTHSRDIDA